MKLSRLYGFAVLMLSACATSTAPVQTGIFDSAETMFAEARAKAISIAAPVFRANAPYCSRTQTIDFTDEPAFDICAQQIRLLHGAAANAHTEGQFIYVYDGAVLALSKDETAFLIAHELAHDILGHNMAAGSYPQAEIEADRVAVAVMHRSGFSPRAVPPFLRRMGFETSPESDSHPAGIMRIETVENAILDLGL